LEPFRGIAGDYDAMFAAWLPAEWRVYDVARGERPARLDECDGYVTTGSRASVYDEEPWIHGFADLVREMHVAGVPFAGVCFGHQMMGHALGGRVAKSPNGWGIGVHTFAVARHEPWMQPPLEEMRVLMSCQDQVLGLPPGAEVLAGNAFCPVGVFRLGRMLGVQGHPEFPVAYAEALMLHRAARIGEERVAAARATLTQTPHAAELAAWIRAWFAYRP
jgi:GMP synthase-like glutamine amidotransferase